MPKKFCRKPASLETQCTNRYVEYLLNEVSLIIQLKHFEGTSLLLQHVNPQTMLEILEDRLDTQLTGLQREIVRQRMADIIIHNFHNVVKGLPPPGEADSTCRDSKSGRTGADGESLQLSTHSNSLAKVPTNEQWKMLPLLKLLDLVMHPELKRLDFGRNKNWYENDRWHEVAKALFKVIGDKCRSLTKFVIPKELVYSNSLNGVISNNSSLTCLTLKRNVPNNMFLNVVGANCPNLQEFDIAGADVVTDFGVICLLFGDPEQIFMECWNREKTVGSVRRSQRAFPHPHFDKPIPDPSDSSSSSGNGNGNANNAHAPSSSRANTQYLHLRKTFHEVIRRGSGFNWDRLPICDSLKKIRLENTKVKGDGASVVLETCPNIYSLGYLVFTAAGLKQVYGYESTNRRTNFTEIFYRGPSDQKLQTIANCCPKLETMFLGSNSPRRLQASVFKSWKSLRYLTLENIFVNDVTDCLNIVGKQLRGLKIQCLHFDIADVALSCPNLESLIIQKDKPSLVNLGGRVNSHSKIFQRLLQLESTCHALPKSVFQFVLTHAPNLRSCKVLHVPDLTRLDLAEWAERLPHLESLVLFRGPSITKDAVDYLLESLPSLTQLGDFYTFDVKKPSDLRRYASRILEEGWDLTLLESESSEEKYFGRHLSLHWFYLTNDKRKASL